MFKLLPLATVDPATSDWGEEGHPSTRRPDLKRRMSGSSFSSSLCALEHQLNERKAQVGLFQDRIGSLDQEFQTKQETMERTIKVQDTLAL